MVDYDVNIRLDGLPRIKKKLREIESSPLSKSLMSEVGLFILARIKSRTIRGVDYSGKLFKPYSQQYKLFRKKKGHPTNKVNLTFTGSMLASMDFDSSEKQTRVFFLNTRDSTGTENPKKAFFLNEERKFFALSKDDVQRIMQMVTSYYRRLL